MLFHGLDFLVKLCVQSLRRPQVQAASLSTCHSHWFKAQGTKNPSSIQRFWGLKSGMYRHRHVTNGWKSGTSQIRCLDTKYYVYIYILYIYIYVYQYDQKTTKKADQKRPKPTWKAAKHLHRGWSQWSPSAHAIHHLQGEKKLQMQPSVWGWFTIPPIWLCVQNLVPLVNIKIAGKWMFIPLEMVLIGVNPYPYPLKILKGILGRVYGYGFPHLNLESRKIATSPYYLSSKNAEITDWPIPLSLAQFEPPWCCQRHLLL